MLCTCQVTDVQFSPDGYILASAAADGQVKLWDLRAGKPMHTFQASVNVLNRFFVGNYFMPCC